MKKYLLLILLILTACSNVDKKEQYYSNSLKINIVFNKDFKTFEKGYLKIILLNKETDEKIDEKIIYNISNKGNVSNNKKILVNFDKLKENSDKKKISLELYADTNSDGILEKYSGIIKENEIKNVSIKDYYTFNIR